MGEAGHWLSKDWDTGHLCPVKKTILLVNTRFNKERTKVANLATYFWIVYVPILRDIHRKIFEKSSKTGEIPFDGASNNYDTWKNWIFLFQAQKRGGLGVITGLSPHILGIFFRGYLSAPMDQIQYSEIYIIA